MAHARFSYEDTVPPVKSLLANGVPSLTAIDTYIADLDVTLDDNARQLDSCLQDVMTFTNDIVGKAYITPRDALLSMLSNHVLEKDSCYDPEADAITDILTHAASTLEKVPGSEEAVLQDLLSLSSEQGLSLPLKASVVDPIASTLSINAISDSSELQIGQQWDQIALHLRRYFYDHLSHLPVVATKPEIDINERRRLKYLQSLITLQPMEEVWDRYQDLRRQQIARCFNTLMPETEPDKIDFLAITERCKGIADIIIQMMDEDFQVLNSGVLKKTPNIFRAFHKIYLEKYSDEMSALVEEIWDEIRDGFTARGTSQSFSVQASKRKVKTAKLTAGNLLKLQAQSLESVVTGQCENAGAEPPVPPLPVEYTKAMLNIVSTVLKLEDHVENLQRASLWDFVGLAVKKTRRKGSLRGVLKPSSSPEANRRPLSATMSSVDSDVWMSDSLMNSVSSVSSSALTDTTSSKVTVVEKMKTEEKVRWDWKMMFKRIAPDLATHVEQHLRHTATETLSREQQQWAQSHTLETCAVRESLWGGRFDYPKVVSKSVFELMEDVQSFVPFAKAGADGTLNTVRVAFVDTVNLCLKNIHVHLLKISTDVPVHSSIKSLYVVISSAAYIRNLLLHYDTVLTTEESKTPFGLLYKQFTELVESLTQSLTQLHNNNMATSVLHDVDSNNWAEMKECYEGERCTFPVQMWNYYLRGVRHDMWTICPPRLALSTFAGLLHDSLQTLVQRYSQVRPSFRRVDQFRWDILTILHCASEMLFQCTGSISGCIDASHSQVPLHSIHNMCSTLLSCMAVVTSPLETLYKINKKGYRYRQRRKMEAQMGEASVRNSNTQWLSWIQTTLLQKGIKSYDDMRTTTAIYLQVKLLLAQPDMNFALTVQAYLMKDYTLSILFLTQALGQLQQGGSDNQSRVRSAAVDNARVFVTALMNVLLRCGHFPDSLEKIVLPVIDRCQDWPCLDVKHTPGKDMPVPLWMECLFTYMKPFTHRALKPVLDFIVSVPEEGRTIQPVSAVLEELPCGCRSHPPTTPRARRSDGRDLVESALRLVVSQLADDVFVLTAPVCVLLKALEDNCALRGMKTPHHCVGLKVLALSLRACLSNVSWLESVIGTSLTQSMKDDFLLLADCVYHVLVSGKVKGSTTPRLAGKFCKENKDWINDRIQIIVNYLNSEIFENGENMVLEGATTEFADQLYSAVACDVLASETGNEDLERLYWMIHNNRDWLQTHMDIKLVLPPAQSAPTPPPFVVDMTAKPVPEFNPLTEFQMVGSCRLDHETIQKLPIDWERLLQTELGLSDFGFRSLLYNRHEMADGAYLEEKEKKPVATLRAVFENEPRELG